MLNINPTVLGFTLLEVLLALLFTSLMATGIAQHLSLSARVNHTMQQEALAARAIESLLLQAALSSSSSQEVKTALQQLSCPSSSTSQLDFSSWCQALQDLPGLQVHISSTHLTLHWQAGGTSRSLLRPSLSSLN